MSYIYMLEYTDIVKNTYTHIRTSNCIHIHILLYNYDSIHYLLILHPCSPFVDRPGFSKLGERERTGARKGAVSLGGLRVVSGREKNVERENRGFGR